MKKEPLFIYACLFLAVSSLQSCGPVLFAGGTTVLSMSSQDQGLDGALDDQSLKFNIKTALMDKNLDLYNRINLNVLEGNVLLTGSVPAPEAENEILTVVKGVSGIRHVFNELTIGEEDGIGDAMSDAWVSGKIRSELFLTHDIRSSNFLIHTNKGIVYLMGVAQSQKELDDVIDIIRSTSGVEKVVNMTRFKDDPLPKRHIIEKKHTAAEEKKIKATPVERRPMAEGLEPRDAGAIDSRPLEAISPAA